MLAALTPSGDDSGANELSGDHSHVIVVTVAGGKYYFGGELAPV